MPDRPFVRLDGHAGRRVAHDDEFVAKLPSLARGRFDAELGGDPAEDDGPYPTAPELGIEVGAEKRPPGGLGDLEIAGLGQAEREVGKAFSRRLDPHLNHRCRL